MSEDNTVTNSSGNVFADLGLSEPEIRQKHAENAWRAGESIMETFRDDPDEVCVNYVAAVIYDLLRKEARRLSARIAELETALKPFADEAADWGDIHPNHFHPMCDVEGFFDADGDRPEKATFTVGDLRRARAALSDYQANGGVTLDELKEEIGAVADPKPFMCMAYDVGPHSGISHHPDCNGECGVSDHHGSEGEK